jgi:hypothetical protein
VYQPAPVVLSPDRGSTLNNNRPTYSGSAEPGSTVTVWMDETQAGIASMNAAGDWAFTPATALSEGFHQAVAIATDSAGNASSPSPALYFNLDTVPSAAPEVLSPKAIVNTLKPTISGTAEAESTVTVWLDGMAVGTALADETGAWHLTLATALADGRHRAVAISVDTAGNTSPPSAEYSFTIPKGNYRWSCASAPAFPLSWALLALACSLRRHPPGTTQRELERSGGGGNRTHVRRCETSSRIAPLPRNRPECLGVDIPPRPMSSHPVPAHSAGSCDIRATWRTR